MGGYSGVRKDFNNGLGMHAIEATAFRHMGGMIMMKRDTYYTYDAYSAFSAFDLHRERYIYNVYHEQSYESNIVYIFNTMIAIVAR